MVLISHRTNVDSALRIVVHGFSREEAALDVERGANFFLTAASIGNNETRRGVILNFAWHGPVVQGVEPPFQDNILYDFGRWRQFISRCNSHELVLVGYDLEQDEIDFRLVRNLLDRLLGRTVRPKIEATLNGALNRALPVA